MGTILYYTILCYTILYYTIVYYTIRYTIRYTILYYILYYITHIKAFKGQLRDLFEGVAGRPVWLAGGRARRWGRMGSVRADSRQPTGRLTWQGLHNIILHSTIYKLIFWSPKIKKISNSIEGFAYF